MDSVLHPDPYIKLVTELGDMRQVRALQDIESDRGTVLVKRGESVDSSKYDRLASRRLRRPLDYTLAVEERVTAERLMLDGKRLLKDEPELREAIDKRFIQRDLLTPLGTVPLEPQMAFRLTVCRERCAERYQHMMRVALIALYVASRLRWQADDRQELATAALFLDLGEMHLEPSIYASRQPLSMAQHRQIYSHPEIAYRFLKMFPSYHPRISKVVHQHHERLDGSGYPRGLSGDDVIPAARVLGAAELLTAIRLERKNSSISLFSTAEVLKFNSERFGQDIMAPLIEAATRVDEAMDRSSNASSVNKTILQARMKLLNDILQGADAIDVTGNDEMAMFIVEQLRRLTGMAKRCGFDLRAPVKLLNIIGDEERALSELDALVREMIYLVQSTAREALRRWVNDGVPEQEQQPLTKWLRHTDLALYSAGFLSH
ncbi:MAG: HD domain-containing phosphohydrolase [Candidatus Thiodiazotropha sp.]|nr:HD domain-containing protein [Candidatus Thiodiazotropha sp. (ex Lucina pensylvanica)]MBT3064834.1 HD domain-containing protein [Candidatus Thiodiazotropha sp. (ex Lucina pensylvanica)]